uniref:Uncharacterized protein n=1 Tax=Aegilops tauschii subsp. strangulata TaxID=200361 RepID=A0A453JXR0_AEGTS
SINTLVKVLIGKLAHQYMNACMLGQSRQRRKSPRYSAYDVGWSCHFSQIGERNRATSYICFLDTSLLGRSGGQCIHVRLWWRPCSGLDLSSVLTHELNRSSCSFR